MEFPHIKSGSGGDWRSPGRSEHDADDAPSSQAQTPPRGTPLCQVCGYELSGTPAGGICPECGTPARSHVGAQEGSGLAIASLILGILSLVTGVIGAPLGVAAVVLAHKVRIAVQEGRTPESALSMANAGRILGWVGSILGTLATIAMLFFFLFATSMIRSLP